MPLGDLHKKLYNRENDLDKRRLADDFFDPKKDVEKPVAENKDNSKEKTADGGISQVTQDVWLSPEDMAAREDDEKKRQKAEHKRKLLKYSLIALGSILLLVLLIFAVVKYRESTFSEDRVQMEIFGPTDIKSGQEVSFDISITNHNRVALEKSSLKLSFSEDFQLQDQPNLIKEGFNGARIEVGEIKSGENKKYTVTAKTFGPNSKQIYFNGSLIYQPSNFSSSFEKKAQLSGQISASLVSINLVATREVASGEEAQLEVIVQNSSSQPVADMYVKVDYPDGFSVKKSDPSPMEGNNVWKLDTVPANDQKKIVVTGVLEGAQDSIKNFKAYLGKNQTAEFLKYSQASANVTVVAPRIVIEQWVNNNKDYTANAGDTMEVTIKFKNNSNAALRDLVLTDKLSSPVLNEAGVSVTQGFYDSNQDQIIWKAADVPALKVLSPGQEGQVTFRLGVMDKFPMESEKDKNFVIKSQASIESLDVDTPLGQNKTVLSNNLDIKVNSKLILTVAANYNDGQLPNTGPIPMKVGQETTFATRFTLLNTSNDLKEVKLVTSLPSGVVWKDRTSGENTGLQYNQRTNEVIWDLGMVKAGVGFLSPVRTLAFQVGITPSANGVGQPVKLLNNTKVTAVDTFTNKTVEYSFPDVYSSQVGDLSHNDTLVSQ